MIVTPLGEPVDTSLIIFHWYWAANSGYGEGEKRLIVGMSCDRKMSLTNNQDCDLPLAKFRIVHKVAI